MYNSVTPVLPSNFSFEPNSRIHLVIGYEDFTTGQRAMKSCQRLIERLTHEFQFHTTLWKFDVLRAPTLREVAVRDIADADMVVISAHGRELPGEVKSWIGTIGTLPGKSQGGAKALVALLDGEKDSAASPVQSYLQEVARKADLDFFSQRSPGGEADLEVSAGHREASEQITPSIEEELFEISGVQRDWGINE